MRSVLLIGLLILLCGLKPSIEISGPSEVKLNDQLKILCFKSGIVLYECEEEEFFSDSKSSDYKCSAVNINASPWPKNIWDDLKENMWLFKGGEKLNSACPVGDYYIDMESIKSCADKGYKNCTNTVYTNKGWMPARNRPK